METQSIGSTQFDDAGDAVHDHGDGYTREEKLGDIDAAPHSGNKVHKDNRNRGAEKGADGEGIGAKEREGAKKHPEGSEGGSAGGDAEDERIRQAVAHQRLHGDAAHRQRSTDYQTEADPGQPQTQNDVLVKLCPVLRDQRADQGDLAE